MLRKWVTRVLATVVVLVFLADVVIATVCWWPVQNPRLQYGSGKPGTYAASMTTFAQIHKREKANPLIKPECWSRLLQHGHRTAKAVVMFHGYTSCPREFERLAQEFYAQGYNVYVPLAPLHGLSSPPHADANLTAGQLASYGDEAATLGSGLGDEMGVAGLSGGGVVASWCAIYRPDVVRRALIISPFYQPSASQVPPWEVRPFLTLYGHGVRLFGHRWPPDKFTTSGLSYYALAQYVILADNLFGQPLPKGLKSVAMVLSPGDVFIDQGRARVAITRLSPNATVSVTPPEWGLVHDIVDPDGPDINGHANDLNPRYFDLYEGRKISWN